MVSSVILTVSRPGLWCHLSYWQWAGHVYGVICHIDSEQAMFMKSVIVNIATCKVTLAKIGCLFASCACKKNKCIFLCLRMCQMINRVSGGFLCLLTQPSFQSIMDIRKFLQVAIRRQTILMWFCDWILGHRIMIWVHSFRAWTSGGTAAGQAAATVNVWAYSSKD